MPKRRTEDVVHAIMTDHLIQRDSPPAKELLAARQEVPDNPANAYRGPVKRYLLDHEIAGPNDTLYDAAAQVIDSSNLEAGTPALADLIRAQQPNQPSFSIELGDAMRHTGDLQGAIDAYKRALDLDPLSSRAQRRLAVTLGSAGQFDEAKAVLSGAIEREPNNELLWYEQAQLESRSGSTEKAVASLKKALHLKPDFADAWNNLGSILAQFGDQSGAENAFREALAINPYDSGTQANFGRLLAGESDWNQAAFHLQKAVRLDSSNANAHGDYAAVLMQLQRLPEAESEAKAAMMGDAKSARAHDLLGQIFAQKRQLTSARTEFEASLKVNPEFGPAQLDLAETLIDQGQASTAVDLLEKAMRSSSPEIAQRAHTMLQELNKRR
jgi:FimV-like protein